MKYVTSNLARLRINVLQQTRSHECVSLVFHPQCACTDFPHFLRVNKHISSTQQ